MNKKIKLTQARKIFNQLRKEGKIEIRKHAYKDYPEREFSDAEIRFLISETNGKLSDNNRFPTSTKGSFLYDCKDLRGRQCEFALLIENTLVVIHAFRRVKS